MKIKITPLLISFFISQNIFSQPTFEWQKSLGGSAEDVAYSIQQTADEGYVVAGYVISNDGDVTGNHGVQDMWIVKLNGIGVIQWQKALGGTFQDRAKEIIQTSDGGYVVAGYSHSNDGDVTGHHGSTTFSDCWIVKLDGNGTIQWQKSLGGSVLDMANSIRQTSDGGYIVTGYAGSIDGDVTGQHGLGDLWVVKLDNSGSIQWQKALGGTATDEGLAILQTLDGGYIVAGHTSSNDGDVTGYHGGTGTDSWVVKVDVSGNIQWQKALGGTHNDLAYSVLQTPDGGYLVMGYTGSIDGDVTGHHGAVGFTDLWLVKLDGSGVLQWQKAMGGTNNEFGHSIEHDNNGGYLVAGRAASNDGDVNAHIGNPSQHDYWIVNIDTSGNILWERSLGGTLDDLGQCMILTNDNGYVMGGFSYSNDFEVSGNHGGADFWIVKRALNFNTIKGKLFVDINSNNIQDTGEPDMGYRVVSETTTGSVCSCHY